MDFRVLGSLGVVDDGRQVVVGPAKQRALLALLIINVNQVLSTDRIIDELWGDDPPESGAKTLAWHVSKLRDALEPGRDAGDPGGHLLTEPGGYVLRVDPDHIDAVRCERLASEARAVVHDDPHSAEIKLREALALWRGAPLADFAYQPFAQSEIHRLGELRLRLLEDRLEVDLMLGRDDLVIGELEGLVAEHPLRERLRGQLMLALYRSDRQAEALRAYQEGRRMLAGELGIDPSQELQQLEQQILSQDSALDAARLPQPATTVRNPYKGLRPFGEADADDFFGRDSLTDRLLQRVAQATTAERFLVVVGPSGSGKSSVVRAGLLPALRSGAVLGSERWKAAVMYPGSRPFEELEAALLRVAVNPPPSLLEQLEENENGLARAVMRILPDDDSTLMLVIDQFEEVFSLVTDDAVRDRFLDSLLMAMSGEHSRLLVVATLRADFFDRPLLHPDFGELVRIGLEAVTPLSRDELELAIAKPAEGVGVQLEPGLATEIVADVTNQPGTLPLLQYALTELFDQSDGRLLTRTGYSSIGGVLGALGRRADEAFEGLDESGRAAARQVFLRLVTLGEGTEDTRRRVLRSELESVLGDVELLDTVVEQFGRSRLLAFDRDPVNGEPTVELAHEAMLARWPRLARWVDEGREDIWMYRRLGEASLDWERAGRQTDFLLSGSRLEQYESWSAATELQLSDTEQAFLEAGLAERRRQKQEEEDRAAHEQRLEDRARTRLRALVAVFAIAALVAGVLSVFAFIQRRTAQEQREVALARELAAAAVGNLRVDPQLSLLLAVEAASVTSDREFIVEEAMDALHWALQEAQVPYPDAGVGVAVRAAPGGLRGVYLLPPIELMRLARDHADRSLTLEECRTFLRVDTCPESSPAPDELAVYTEAGPIPVDQLAATGIQPLEGARVRTFIQAGGLVEGILGEFPSRSGIQVQTELGGEDFEFEIATKLATGDLPDIALITRAGLMADLAREGRLIDMSAFLDVDQLRRDFGDYLIEVGTVDTDGTWPAEEGGFYGATWSAAVNSLVWYPVPEFEEAGYQIPGTWEELLALSRQMVADGHNPWCMGVSYGSVSGFIATEWVEDLVLRNAGRDRYDQWASHEIPFTDQTVREAFEMFGSVAFAEGFVLGGSDAITRNIYTAAADPMFRDPPDCWLHRDVGAGRMFWGERHGAEADFFTVPVVGDQDPNGVVGGAYLLVVFRDRPEVRELVGFMLSPEFADSMAGTFLPEAGILPARPVDPSIYLGDIGRAQGDLLQSTLNAGTFRINASDLMPLEVGSGAFYQGMLDYLDGGPDNLDQVLATIEASWALTEN